MPPLIEDFFRKGTKFERNFYCQLPIGRNGCSCDGKVLFARVNLIKLYTYILLWYMCKKYVKLLYTHIFLFVQNCTSMITFIVIYIGTYYYLDSYTINTKMPIFRTEFSTGTGNKIQICLDWKRFDMTDFFRSKNAWVILRRSWLSRNSSTAGGIFSIFLSLTENFDVYIHLYEVSFL